MRKKRMSMNQVIKAIKKNSRFLITSHVSAEGDALGSALALASLLRKKGKKAYVVNADKTPSNYTFLPGAKKILSNIKASAFDVAIIVDCPVIQRIGNIVNVINNKPIIVIDHHIDNKRFGKINWIDPDASSVGEMIFALFKKMRVKIDKKDALNLYAALLTDTGSFKHANTSAKVLEIASELVRCGVVPSDIYRKIYETNTQEDVMYLAKLISSLSFTANGKIAYLEIKKNMCKKIDGRAELIDRVFDFAKSIYKVKAVVLFYELSGNLVKLSLRSKHPVNVQKVAKKFGGGGHCCASGGRINGKYNQIRNSVLNELKRTVKAL
jgi:phosphoesterase RecJ-like protein